MAKIKNILSKVGEDEEKLDPSYSIGGGVKEYRHSGKFDSFLKN